MRRGRKPLVTLAAALVVGTGAVALQASDHTTMPSPSRSALLHEALAYAHRLHAGVRTAKLDRVGPSDGPVTEVAYYNWSGFADATTDQEITRCAPQDGCQSISYVSASWRIPAVTCPPRPFQNENDLAAVWVGIDGFNDQTVEQTGTTSFCFEGQPYYITWWWDYPGPTMTIGSTARAGDEITASVTVKPVSPGEDSYGLQLTDSTTPGNHISTTQQPASTTAPNG